MTEAEPILENIFANIDQYKEGKTTAQVAVQSMHFLQLYKVAEIPAVRDYLRLFAPIPEFKDAIITEVETIVKGAQEAKKYPDTQVTPIEKIEGYTKLIMTLDINDPEFFTSLNVILDRFRPIAGERIAQLHGAGKGQKDTEAKEQETAEQKADRLLANVVRSEFESHQEYSFISIKSGKGFVSTRQKNEIARDRNYGDYDLDREYDIVPIAKDRIEINRMSSRSTLIPLSIARLIDPNLAPVSTPQNPYPADNLKEGELFCLVGEKDGKIIIQGGGQLHTEFGKRLGSSSYKLVFDNVNAANEYLTWLQTDPKNAYGTVLRRATGQYDEQGNFIKALIPPKGEGYGGREVFFDPFASPPSKVLIKDLRNPEENQNEQESKAAAELAEQKESIIKEALGLFDELLDGVKDFHSADTQFIGVIGSAVSELNKKLDQANIEDIAYSNVAQLTQQVAQMIRSRLDIIAAESAKLGLDKHQDHRSKVEFLLRQAANEPDPVKALQLTNEASSIFSAEIQEFNDKRNRETVAQPRSDINTVVGNNNIHAAWIVNAVESRSHKATDLLAMHYKADSDKFSETVHQSMIQLMKEDGGILMKLQKKGVNFSRVASELMHLQLRAAIKKQFPTKPAKKAGGIGEENKPTE